MPETPSCELPLRYASVTPRCGFCGAVLVGGRARLFCDGVCRQAAYRRRHQPAPELVKLPVVRPKESTVYECDGCGERFVGTQRCEGCNRFARRVGRGGHCPSCDEPVAIVELLGGET
ncbi:MAG: hypothetical protein ACRD1K_06210 [Acidimicrobiales bacterium]